MPTQIAVIGGGAGGVAMCLKLYDQISQKIVNNNSGEVVAEITVFEKAAVVGPGLPYSSPYKCHMLNFPKKIMMGVFDSTALDNAAEPDNSSAEDRETIYNSYQETVFPPRHLYGEFLANRAEQVQKAAKKIGVVITFRKGTEVLNVKKLSENQLQLETSAEETFIANYVVLATGHMESSRYRELKGSKGYHHNPFDAKKALESFDPKKDVVIIGTRKTAIDVSLRLFTEEKLEGKVTMVSHNGLMPSIYAKQFINQPLQYLHDYIGSVDGQLSLDALLPLFWKELSNVQGTNVTLASVAKSYKDISALDWLNQQIEECDRTLKPWQQVLVSIFPLIPNIWRRLSVTDQETFLKKYYSLFMAYAAGFPQDAAKEVRKLIEEDRLDVRGGLTKISATEDGQFEVQFENGDNLTTSQLFNATGAGYDISSLPVYRNMCEQGLIVAHRMGGISVAPESFHVLDNEGKENDRIFAIGELTRGVVLLTSDIRRVTMHAEIVADIITKNMLPVKKVRESNRA